MRGNNNFKLMNWLAITIEFVPVDTVRAHRGKAITTKQLIKLFENIFN